MVLRYYAYKTLLHETTHEMEKYIGNTELLVADPIWIVAHAFQFGHCIEPTDSDLFAADPLQTPAHLHEVLATKGIPWVKIRIFHLRYDDYWLWQEIHFVSRR